MRHSPLESSSGEMANLQSTLKTVKRFCTKNVFFASNQQDSDIYLYYQKTISMLDCEINSPEIDDEKFYTILSNLALIATNSMSAGYFKNNNKSPLEFSTTSRNCHSLMTLIDNQWRITKKYNKAQASKERHLRISSFLQKVTSSLLLVMGLGTLGSGIFSIYFFKKANSSTAPEKGFIENIEHWWDYKIRKMPMPMTTEEKWQAYFQNAKSIFRIFIFLSLIFLLAALFIFIERRIFKKRCIQAENTWSDFQQLTHVLEQTQARIDKEEQLWAEA